MKRVIILTMLVMVGTALLGCQQGVTDVGNPTISQKPPQVDPASPSNPDTALPGPTVEQLVGGYTLPTPTQSGTEAPDTTPDSPQAGALPPCRADSQRVQSIMSTMNPTQIILHHFLDYGPMTDHVLATYDAKTGAIAFDLSEALLAITSCSGTATKSSDGILVTLQCKSSAGADDAGCRVAFEKK